MKRVVVWAVLLLSALFLLTTGGTYPGIASVEAHIIGQVIAYVVLGGWCIVALFRPEWRPTTPLLLPIALATGAYLLSFAFSQRPRLSLEPTIAGVGWAVGYLFLSRLLAEPWFRTRVRAVLVVFTAMVAVGYIVQVMVEWVRWWSLIGFLAVPPLRPSFAGLWLGSPNLVATALLLLGPLSVVLLWERSRRRWLAVSLAAASLIAVFLSGSRGAWVGAGTGSLVVAAFVAGRRDPRALLRDLARGVRRRPLLVAPFAVVVLVGIALLPAVLRRFTVGGEDLRIDLWRSALAIFAEHAVTGGGPGTWVQLKLAANPPGTPNLVLPHAHDMYVQSAAELGLAGIVCLGVLGAAVILRLVRAARTRAASSLAGWAALTTLAAFATQSLVDNLVNLPFVCLALAVTVAWVDAGKPTESAPAKPRAQPTLSTAAVPAAVLVGLVLLVPNLFRINSAALSDLSGNHAAIRMDWDGALRHYDAARTLDPDFTLYEIQTASALSRTGRLAEAQSALANAVVSDPLGLHLIGMAAISSELGDMSAALEAAHAALKSAPGDPTVALNAGLVAERAGDVAFASEAFGLAIAAMPSLAGDPFFGRLERLMGRAAVVDVARANGDPLTAALVVAFAGDPQAALVELAGQAPSARRDVYIAVSIWQAGDPAGALAALETRLRELPQDWFAAAWAARVAYAMSSPSLGDRYADWARAVQADSASGVLDDVVILSRAEPGGTAGLPRNYPWAVYLRPVSAGLAMGQIVLVGAR